MQNLPSRFETLGATQSNIGRMVAAGVKVAVADVGSPSISPQLPQQAGQLVAQARIPGATGLTHEQAIAAITSVPADMFGMRGAGRITPGSLADIVIWSGDPLETASAPTAIWIEGVEQPMDSRQSRLADRYNPTKAPTGLPRQYSRSR
jgi:imidazolonepropionase-like amidohydrolase